MNKSQVTTLLKQSGFAPNKSLGQNFLVDENITAKIASNTIPPDEFVLEIGAGLGSLTEELIKRAKKVVAVEIDGGFFRILCDRFSASANLELIHADALKLDFSEISRKYFDGKRFCVAGNLPYYITSQLIIAVIESGVVNRFVAMVQSEYCDRLCAKPGDVNYGAITASVAYYGKIEPLFSVGSSCFFPKPKVDSRVFAIDPNPVFNVERKAYTKVVRGLFAMRRKTVYNNMMKMQISPKVALNVLQNVGISPSQRAEKLSPGDFAKIAELLETTSP